MEQINYDAGRKQNTYVAEDLLPENFIKGNEFFSSFRAFISLNQKIKMINVKVDRLADLLKQAEINRNPLNETLFGPPNNSAPHYLAKLPHHITEYKSLGEEIILHMKVILDSIVQIIYMEFEEMDFLSSKKIKIDSIGQLLDENQNNGLIKDIIIGNDLYEKDPTNFFGHLNDIFNSLKHSIFHTESSLMFPEKYPSITTFYVKRSNLNNGVTFHNYNAYHLMMGFQDNFKRIIGNWKNARQSRNNSC